MATSRNALAEPGPDSPRRSAAFQQAIRIDPRVCRGSLQSRQCSARPEQVRRGRRRVSRRHPHQARLGDGLWRARAARSTIRANSTRPPRSIAEPIEFKPDFDAAGSSTLLFCMNYSEHVSPAALFEAHRAWEERHGRPVPPAAYANDRSAARRLKVGYVSPDFRQHSVAYFLEPLLRSHDRTRSSCSAMPR